MEQFATKQDLADRIAADRCECYSDRDFEVERQAAMKQLKWTNAPVARAFFGIDTVSGIWSLFTQANSKPEYYFVGGSNE